MPTNSVNKNTQLNKETAKVNSRSTLNANFKNTTNESSRRKDIITAITAAVISLIIITGIITSVFYVVIKNNVNGAAEKYRSKISGIPILKNALPEIEDPEDPYKYSERELRQKFLEVKEKRDELAKLLEEANLKINELEKYKNENMAASEQNENMRKELEQQRLAIEEEKRKLQEDKVILEEMAAKGDTEGFKKYYSQINKETAQKIYEKILNEEQIDQKTREFVKIYEEMDAGAAAQIFEKLSENDMQLVVKIIKNMGKESSAEIMSSLKPQLAAEITRIISEEYIK